MKNISRMINQATCAKLKWLAFFWNTIFLVLFSVINLVKALSSQLFTIFYFISFPFKKYSTLYLFSPITDIDECLFEKTCHSNATCSNTLGSFICACKAGYTGNGHNCSGMLSLSSAVRLLQLRFYRKATFLLVGYVTTLQPEENSH